MVLYKGWFLHCLHLFPLRFILTNFARFLCATSPGCPGDLEQMCLALCSLCVNVRIGNTQEGGITMPGLELHNP